MRCRNCCVRGFLRRREDRLRRPFLEDAAVVEEADAVGDVARERHLVRREHHRHPALRELADHLEHLGDELRVERARHLVEQHQLGLHRERAHDRDALLLAAREPVGIVASRLSARPNRSSSVVRAARPRRCFDRPSASRGASVTLRSTVMCGKRLYDWKTIPIRRRTAFTSRARVISSPAEQDAARVDRLEQVDAAQERRLAGARGADQADDLVLADREVDAAQHLVLAERLVQALDPRARRVTARRPTGAGGGRAGSASR